MDTQELLHEGSPLLRVRQPNRVAALAAVAAYLLLPGQEAQAQNQSPACRDSGPLTALCAKGPANHVCVRHNPCESAKEVKPRVERARLLRRLFI